MKKKVQAVMFEGDDILLLTNTQIGRNRRVIEREFLLGGATPYEIFTNSTASDSKGVLIAVKMRANIQIVNMIKDDEDRILLLKIVKDNETITVGSIYDDNRNTTRVLTKLEELLDKIDAKQGVIIGGDYNVTKGQKQSNITLTGMILVPSLTSTGRNTRMELISPMYLTQSTTEKPQNSEGDLTNFW